MYKAIKTNKDINKLVNIIYTKILADKDNFNPDIVVGITRGGLSPAVQLSHLLCLEMETWKVALRDNPRVDPFPITDKNLKILIVEDINDLGQTLFAIHKILKELGFNMKNIRYAVLIENKFSVFKNVSYYGELIEKRVDDPFIYFPWEKLPKIKSFCGILWEKIKKLLN